VDSDLAGLLITGTGDVFAPGGDLGQAAEDNWMDFASTMGMDVTPFDVLRLSAKPVVSAVSGLCQGGGLQIAMCSDLSVVSDRATFRVPELFRGIADTYYSQVLARMIGPVRTKDLMFTERTLNAEEAVEWGIVARMVPRDEPLEVAKKLLAQCCTGPPRQPTAWSRPALTATWVCSTGSAFRRACSDRRPAKASGLQDQDVADVGPS
jgi:enoyl-CoA hydratase